MYLNHLTQIKPVFLLNGTTQIHKSTSAFAGTTKADGSTSFFKTVMYTLWTHRKVLTAFKFMVFAHRIINVICLTAMFIEISDEVDKFYQIPDEDGNDFLSMGFILNFLES